MSISSRTSPSASATSSRSTTSRSTSPSGSLTALLGPSGSASRPCSASSPGSSGPTPATILLAGEDVTALAPQKRDIGFVFQHYAAFKHMTVRDNVAFGLKIRRRPKAEIRERVDELLEPRPAPGARRTAIRHSSRAGSASGWASRERSRAEPQVLLLDEPFGALDARVRTELRDVAAAPPRRACT